MIQVLSRTAEILKFVAESPEGLRLYELTELMELKRSTVHNLTSSLLHEGLLEKDQDSRYQLGPLFRELYDIQRKNEFYGCIKKRMLHLAALVKGSSLTYAQFGNGEIIEFFRIVPDQPRKIHTIEGGVLNPYFTVGGILHFAFLPESKRNLLTMHHPFIPKGQELWGNEQALSQAVADCRKRHYGLMPLDPPEMLRLGIPVMQNGNFAGSLTWAKHNFTNEEKELMLQEANKS
ncbi:MAG: helix-turn-helix domain-containing protein [Victivallales bacterium]|nr:helix-turn-helix domain-containing protein [Victivallales bacterium]